VGGAAMKAPADWEDRVIAAGLVITVLAIAAGLL
jgi:hypothetical protein